MGDRYCTECGAYYEDAHKDGCSDDPANLAARLQRALDLLAQTSKALGGSCVEHDDPDEHARLPAAVAHIVVREARLRVALHDISNSLEGAVLTPKNGKSELVDVMIRLMTQATVAALDSGGEGSTPLAKPLVWSNLRQAWVWVKPPTDADSGE